jgi:hypothetical protein
VAHITIEYVIMVPILIMQIFLFPLTASWLMNIWVDSRRTLVLRDAASHLGSSVQQLYFSVNHKTMSYGKITYSPGLPPLIENHYYYGNASLRTTLDPLMNSSKVLELTLTLAKTTVSVTASVILGPNVLWQESTFISNSTNACITADKFPNETVCIYFEE